MKKTTLLIVVFLIGQLSKELSAYPIDGYKYTGIDRLFYEYQLYKDTLSDTKLDPGALLMLDEIQLNLSNSKAAFPDEDPKLEGKLNAIFRYLEPEYSISIMDITDEDNLIYAGLKEDIGYQPGSVAKIIAAIGLFNALYEVYGDDWATIRGILVTKKVRGNEFVNADHHTIPIYDMEKDRYYNRQALASDVFSLYEWLDHMFSKSSNAAASVIMREMLLVHLLDNYYECANQSYMDKVIESGPRHVLGGITEELTNCALEKIGIERDEYRLGGFFTNGAEKFVSRSGGSIGTTKGLMKFMFKLEKGEVINEDISLEIKRLMYLTDRRIRYAASYVLDSAAVYFKSGSLYSFKPEPGFVRKKYAGNRYNYMNSVAIIERKGQHPRKYMVALMSNVLRKNSVGEHYALAKRMDDLILDLHAI